MDLEGPEPDSEVMLPLQSVSRCGWWGGGFKQLTLGGWLLNFLIYTRGTVLTSDGEVPVSSICEMLSPEHVPGEHCHLPIT